MPDAFDPDRRFVRVKGERENGLVEFEFSIGEPGVCVDMALSRDAFTEFCARHHVTTLPSENFSAPHAIVR
jgi:phenol/toluene 2-monooxygenase (NADH) P0/A0